MIDNVNNEVLNSFTEFNLPSYEDYVLKKGHAIIKLEGVSGNQIRKSGGTLTINSTEYDTSNLTMTGFINLLSKTLPDISISVVEYRDNMKDLLSKMTSKFISDFNSDLIVKKRLLESPILKEPFKFINTKKGDEFTLNSLYAVNLLGNPIHPIEEDHLSIKIPHRDLSGYLVLSYKADTLVLHMLPEFPITEISELFSYGPQQL